jgi:hypothetical protein
MADSLCLTSSDLLLAMEPLQVKTLFPLATSFGAQLTLLGLWCSPERPYLQDPFGLAEAYFQNCFSFIDSAVEGIHQRITPENAQHLFAGMTA